jgi:HAE1 family hydrophobic/amphiphilic exporter-1
MTKLSVRRPVTTFMVMLILVAFGAMSLLNLRMDLLPNMNVPVAIVYTTYRGASPDQIQKLVTEPIEQTLATVKGLDDITSISSEGTSIVVMQFDTSVDINMAAIDMREAVDLIKGYLPEDASEPTVVKMDINQMSAIYISVSSQTDDLVALRTKVEDQIQNRLERQAGVASVNISGGREKEIVVELIQDRIRGLGISEMQIIQLLATENSSSPAGSVEEAGQNLTIKVDAEFGDLEDIRSLPIATPRGGVVYLRDIAQVREVYKERASYSYLDGDPAITLTIQKQSNANTVNVSRAVMKELDRIIQEFPELEIQVILDPADYINLAIRSVADTAVSGTLLAVAVLFIFLRNVRATLVVGASIPLSIIITFSFMYFANMTLNMMSLGGMTLGVGMLVDNSIVVLEAIFRRMERGESRGKAAINGAREVSMSIVASTLTTVSVFVPVAWMGGLIAQVFNDLAISVSFSLGASLLVALTFVPLACSIFLTPPKAERERKNILNRFMDIWTNGIHSLDRHYRKALKWATGHKAIVIISAIIFAIASLGSVLVVGMELLPPADQGQITIDVKLPSGAVLDRAQAVAMQVLSRLEDVPEITNVSTTIGGSSMMSSSTNAASITVALTPMKERDRSSIEIADAIRASVADIAGAEIKVEAVTSMMTNMGTSSTADIQYNIVGDDIQQLIAVADDLVELLRGNIEGLRDVSHSVDETLPQAVITVDRLRASSFGLTAQGIMASVNNSVSGNKATVFKVAGDEIDVRVTKGADAVDNLEQLETLLIPTPTGITIPLREVASVEIIQSPLSVSRLNQRTYVTLNGYLGGRDLGSVTRDIDQKIAQEYILPQGVTIEPTGNQQFMNEEIANLVYAAVVALFVVYAIMAAEFESLFYPFIIMFAVPVALSSGVLGLWVTGQSFGITAALGIVVLIGVVINNGIVLVDYINLLRGKGMSMLMAIQEGCPVRLRAILMTTMTTVLGLVPMMLGSQEGSEVMRPLATVMVFGLTFSTLVTLFVVPCIYILFENIRTKVMGERKKFRQIEEITEEIIPGH